MYDIKNITLIGAGGTGSMLLPALVPTYNVNIYDGDDYEDKNITRQIFSVFNVGNNKAEALAQVFNGGHKDVTASPVMINGSEDIEGDVIICCVDNNDARLAAQSLSDKHDIPLIVCGNETWEPMAWLYLPEYKYTNINPYKRWDLGNLTEGRQMTCAGVEMIEENIQMPAANFCAGGNALYILESLRTMTKTSNYVAEVVSTPWPIFKTIKELEL